MKSKLFSLISYFNKIIKNILRCLGISTHKRNTPDFSFAEDAGKVMYFLLFFTILKF